MIFAIYVLILIGWEALAILTGPKWPPTVTTTVRWLPGPWQAVVALAVVAVPVLHLLEVIA